jgi:4-alpha-glucanotransferase
VTAEDLGTVPDFVRESIARLGLPGYKVLRWERGSPMMYPSNSVAMTGTHDTEPLAVWWESLSAEERRRFGLESPLFDERVRDTVLSLMYNAGSDLLLLPIQDVFGWRDRINQPATINEANWTFVLPWLVDEMRSQPEASERAARLAELSHQTGRRISEW